MMVLTLSDILDDLRAAEEGLHKFERKYWISSEHFYLLYSSGRLDDGENALDFSEWAGHYRLRKKRLESLNQLSSRRVESLQRETDDSSIRLEPAEPALDLR